MRLALLLPVLLCVAAPAHAEGMRESRYGPTTPRQASAAAAAARYDGPMLGWANKRQAVTDAVSAPPAPARAAPLADLSGYRALPTPAVQASPNLIAAALPASLYATPRPTTAITAPAPAAPPARDWSGYRAARVTTTAPAAPERAPPPRQLAAATASTSPVTKDWSSYRSARVLATAAPAPTAIPAEAPAQPRRAAVANSGMTGGRYYSVARESGLTPDPIPSAGPDRQVLITAEAPQAPPEDAVPLHGSADWLAAGARGDDDGNDDSADRRAKRRKQDQ